MTGTATWEPVLEGELAERAEAAVQKVANDLARLDPAERRFGPSFAGGSAGFAVLFGELARDGFPGAAELAAAHVDAAVEAVATDVMPPSYFAGFLSVALAIQLLEGTVLPVPDEPVAAELEEVLLRFLDQSPWRHDYDLISGLVGFAAYAARRQDDAFGQQATALVVRRLGELAVETGGGLAWFTPPGHLPEHQRVAFPEGYYNGGLAHGIPGVVAILGMAAGAGHADARPLLDGAVSWLMARRLAEGATSRYPGMVTPTGEGRPTRLAWCYGDAGVAAALRLAGEAAGLHDLVTAGDDLLREAATRPRDAAGVVDAGLCHGATGLAHVYNRFFQATGDEFFLREARAWFANALDRAVEEDELGGFQSVGEDGAQPDPAFLTGSAGVALALLAATRTRTPEWDQLLLLSQP